MHKKGVTGQVFVYILVIIIIGIAAIFGWRAYSTVKEKTGQAALVSFKTGLASDISKVSYGDVVRKSYDFPTGFDKICVVDEIKDCGVYPDSEVCYSSEEMIVENFLMDKTSINIFLIGPNKFEQLEVDTTTLPQGDYKAQCFNISGGIINLVFKGKGEAVEVRTE